MDTRRRLEGKAPYRNCEDSTDLKSVGKLNSCASSNLAPGIFILSIELKTSSLH